MKTIKSNCTDAELSAAVAEYVAGWHWHTGYFAGENEEGAWRFLSLDGTYADGYRQGPLCRVDQMKLPWRYQSEPIPSFAASADAVLPLLEKTGDARTISHSVSGVGSYSGWRVEVYFRKDHASHVANAPVFARAASFALLKAKGWTVEDAN